MCFQKHVTYFDGYVCFVILALKNQTDQNLILSMTLIRCCPPGLVFEDVRATYTIVMTGPSTAMLEFIDGARTLREVRSGKAETMSSLGTRLLFAKGHLDVEMLFSLRQRDRYWLDRGKQWPLGSINDQAVFSRDAATYFGWWVLLN